MTTTQTTEQAMAERIIRMVAEGLGQDRREVRCLVEAAMSEAAMSEAATGETPQRLSIRLVWRAETYTGRRRSSARVLTDVDAAQTGGREFGTRWLRDGDAIDLPLGTPIIEQLHAGSVKNGWRPWRIGKVNLHGQIEWEHDLGTGTSGNIEIKSRWLDWLDLCQDYIDAGR